MRDATVVGAVVVLVAALGVVPAAAGAGIGTGTSAGDAPGVAVTGPVAGSSGAGTGVAGAASGGASAAQAACSYPLTLTDGSGAEVTVEEEPERIVTLAPSAAQTIWEFNASDKVVGVSDNAGYLEGADEKEVVTEGQNVRTEVIVGLEPDVVIAPNVVGNETVESLRSNGLTVYRARDPKSFTAVYDQIERIGDLSGECAAAEATVTGMQERVTAIREAVADEEPEGGLYVFFGFTTGSGTFIDSIITSAGLENVAGEAGISGFGQVSEEVVANNSEDIEWLVLNDNPASHPSGDVYNETAAMQNDQVVVLNEDYLNQPAPRAVLALENLTRAVYPEAYEEAQASLEATPTPTATAEPTAASTETGTATATATATAESMMTPTATPGEMGGDTPDQTEDPATTANGPGFTVAVGVLAVLAAALFARRRR